MSLNFAILDEFGEIDGEDVADAAIFGVAASYDKELVADDTGGMEPSVTGFDGFLVNLNFLPLLGFQVEGP